MTKDLTEGKPMRLIFFFTLPLIAGNIFQQLYALIDTLLVGRFLGVEALAAVGCTGSLMFLMMGFIMGLTTGFSIYTGQRFGAKDMQGVRRSTAACLVLSLASSIVLMFLGTLFCPVLLRWMQTPPEIMENAVAFIRIVYAGIPFILFFMMLTNLIRALGDSRASTYMLALGLTANIVLEPIFILVFGWGVPGAALAMVTSQVIGVVIGCVYIMKKIPILHLHREDWHMTKEILVAHAKIGLPMGFQTSVIAIGSVILQVALNQLGPVAVAAYAASQKVDSIATMPMMSFGMAMAAYTAQNYGARRLERIEIGVKQCIIMSCSFSILAGAFNIFFGPYIMYMFVGAGQQQVVDYGQTYLVINGACYSILALLFIYRYTLQGLGQTVVPTIAGIMELVMRAVAAIILVENFGYIGACFASPMAWLGACVPLGIAYYVTRRTLRAKRCTV